MEADAPRRVLVVEDSKLFQMSYRSTLTRAGYEVTLASTGGEALPKALACRPDVILLDLLLPCTPGLDVLRVLKQTNELRGIPVVVISSMPPSNQQRVQGEGAARYLHKDELTEDTLLFAVTEALAISRKQRDAERLALSNR